MGFLTTLQQRILDCIINFNQDYGRPVKSDEVAEVLKIHPGSVRNALSTLRVLGFIESKRGPFGGYVPTRKAFSVAKNNDRLNIILLTSDGSPFKASSTITACLTNEKLLLEIANFNKRQFLKRGRKVIIYLEDYFIDGVIVDVNRLQKKVILLVNSLFRPVPPIKVKTNMKICELGELMVRKKSECALVYEDDRVVGYVTKSQLLRTIIKDKELDKPVKNIMSSLPRSRIGRKFVKMGFCRFCSH